MTLLIGMGTTLLGENPHLACRAHSTSIELGQIFVIDAWIAYLGPAATKNPPPTVATLSERKTAAGS